MSFTVGNGGSSGASVVVPTNQVVVKTASDLAAPLLPNVLYLIDGAVDLGAGSIDVPEGGLQIAGLGFDVSSITTTGTMFTYSGAYAGNVQIGSVGLTAPVVFDLDNAENGGAVECTTVNFNSCGSLGELTAYRQGLWNGVGVIFCNAGLTMSGTWSGGLAAITSIAVGAFTSPLFKAGVGLTIGGSFRSDMNAIGLGVDGVFSDFSPANIIQDGGFSMGGVRVSDGGVAFPNMPRTTVKARFSDCVGVKNTYIGGVLGVTVQGTTVISNVDTLYPITATTVGSEMAWFEKSGNGIKYISSQEIDVSISGSFSFSGSNNKEVGVQIRYLDSSTGLYVNVGPEYVSTTNGGTDGTRSENVTFSAYASINNGDIVEVWIKNLSDTSNITTLGHGQFSVRER